MLVPRATNVIAVTESVSPMVHPKCDAKSPIKAVRPPMKMMATTKHAHPPHKSVGGQVAKMIFQKIVRKCMM